MLKEVAIMLTGDVFLDDVDWRVALKQEHRLQVEQLLEVAGRYLF
jgi:hypothetical protein